jgi:hypothetical protein
MPRSVTSFRHPSMGSSWPASAFQTIHLLHKGSVMLFECVLQGKYCAACTCSRAVKSTEAVARSASAKFSLSRKAPGSAISTYA